MKLNLELRGEGPAVVILNGYPVRAEHVEPLGERLARGHQSVVVHLPGYGRSPALVPYDAQQSHALVEDALLEHGIEEASFVGYSYGMHRALAIALRGRVRARALIGLAAVPGYTPEQAAQFAGLAKALATIDLAATLEAVMLSERGRNRPELVAEVRSWAAATATESLAAEILANCAEPNLLPRIAELRIPMLLRVGTDDVAAPPARSREMAAVAAQSEVEEVEGVSHLILTEDLDGTVASVERFLARVGR